MQCARFHRPQESRFDSIVLDQVHQDGWFSGYGSIFSIADLGGDIVAPGAFTNALKRKKINEIKMLFQHDPQQIIGVWQTVKQDTVGLWVEGRLSTNIAKSAEILELMRVGAIDGLSIGFQTKSSSSNPRTNIRTIYEADLWEISIVTFPMQKGARISEFKNIAVPIAPLASAGNERQAQRRIQSVCTGSSAPNNRSGRSRVCGHYQANRTSQVDHLAVQILDAANVMKARTN